MEQVQADQADHGLVGVQRAEGMDQHPDPCHEAEGDQRREGDELRRGEGVSLWRSRGDCGRFLEAGPCGEQLQPVARVTAGSLSIENVHGSISRPGSVLSLRISKEVLPSVAA